MIWISNILLLRVRHPLIDRGRRVLLLLMMIKYQMSVGLYSVSLCIEVVALPNEHKLWTHNVWCQSSYDRMKKISVE